MTAVDRILAQLAELIQLRRFVDLETDGLEIKPVPAQGSEWNQLHVSANAFLNTRGGILILGIKEEGRGADRRYVLSGWQEHAEPKLKEIPRQFTDRKGTPQELFDCFRSPQIHEFLDGRVVVMYIDELAADRRFIFYQGKAYKRVPPVTMSFLIPKLMRKKNSKKKPSMPGNCNLYHK
jgi:ATP-dependent DNA helicase RecG